MNPSPTPPALPSELHQERFTIRPDAPSFAEGEMGGAQKPCPVLQDIERAYQQLEEKQRIAGMEIAHQSNFQRDLSRLSIGLNGECL